jgi:chemotaxis protein methyltransferase CheR
VKLSKENIDYLIGFIKKETGISISADKEYLLESRLSRVIKKLDLEDYNSLISELRFRKEEAVKNTVDALTTNETYFFRDHKPFEFFEKKILPDMILKIPDRSTVRIWCAACSSGQEPYSLAMILRENQNLLEERKVQILATDISNKIISKASEGVFNQFEVQRGLPVTYLVKYFDKLDENHWKIKDEISSSVDFKLLNLIADYDVINECDLIFCRNVLIYFDDETKKMILGKISRKLKKDGYLFLGTSETSNLLPEFYKQNQDMRSIYQKI